MITEQRHVAYDCDTCGTTSPFVVSSEGGTNVAQQAAVNAGWRKCRVVPLVPILERAGMPTELAKRALSRPSSMSRFDWIVCPRCAEQYDAWLKAPRFPA